MIHRARPFRRQKLCSIAALASGGTCWRVFSWDEALRTGIILPSFLPFRLDDTMSTIFFSTYAFVCLTRRLHKNSQVWIRSVTSFMAFFKYLLRSNPYRTRASKPSTYRESWRHAVMVLAAAAMVMFLLSRHQSQSPTRKCLQFGNTISTRSLVKIIDVKRILRGCQVPKIDAEVLRQIGTIVVV